jgi:hypothetical protein
MNTATSLTALSQIAHLFCDASDVKMIQSKSRYSTGYVLSSIPGVRSTKESDGVALRCAEVGHSLCRMSGT